VERAENRTILTVGAVARRRARQGVIHERASGYRHKAVIYRVNCSKCRKRFEQWADRLVAIFGTVGESNRLKKGCGNKVSRKRTFGLRHDLTRDGQRHVAPLLRARYVGRHCGRKARSMTARIMDYTPLLSCPVLSRRLAGVGTWVRGRYLKSFLVCHDLTC